MQYLKHPQKTIVEMKRVTKKNGIILIVDECRTIPSLSGTKKRQALSVLKALKEDIKVLRIGRCAKKKFYYLCLQA